MTNLRKSWMPHSGKGSQNENHVAHISLAKKIIEVSQLIVDKRKKDEEDWEKEYADIQRKEKEAKVKAKKKLTTKKAKKK